jgi:hypothetical protein
MYVGVPPCESIKSMSYVCMYVCLYVCVVPPLQPVRMYVCGMPTNVLLNVSVLTCSVLHVPAVRMYACGMHY